MSKAPQFTDAFKKQTATCVALARGLGTEFSSLREEDDVGHRLTGKRAYIYTREFLTALSDLAKRSIELVGKSVLDREFVEEVLWAIADSDIVEGETGAAFCARLIEPTNQPKLCVLRNYQIRLANGVNEFRLGPVRVIRGEILAAEINKIHKSDIWHAEVGDQIIETEDGSHTTTFSPFCWEVEVRASLGNVHSEAVWLANVAVSLVRVLFPIKYAVGSFPYYGDDEPATDVRPNVSKNSFVYNTTEKSFGGWALPNFYEVTEPILAVLNEPKSQAVAESIFSPMKDSLGARIYRGLGWLARARQSEDLAERYLHIFTALETLLTTEDKATPISETIARHASAILTAKIEARQDIAQTIKRSYGIRSALIHAGVRNISVNDAAVMQKICEILYRAIIHRVDLNTPFKDFDASLRRASFGLPWEHCADEV